MNRKDIKALRIVEIGNKTYIGIPGENGVTEAMQYNGTNDLGKYVKARNDGTVKTITIRGAQAISETGLNDEEEITIGTFIDTMTKVKNRAVSFYENQLFDKWTS